MITTLDEILELIRGGRTPKDVAGGLGITERAIRNRFQSAGRLQEYDNTVRAMESERARNVDLSALMGFADQGRTLNQACVDLGYARADVMRRLEDDGRVVEFYARRYSALNGSRVPAVDAMGYHSGPRSVLVSLIPGLSDEDAARLRDAITSIDQLVRDGASLSRLCGGEAE